MEGKRLIKAVGMVTLIGAIAKLLGFLRESVIAGYYGTTPQAEVYFVAIVIPAILFNAMSTSISGAMVPIYAEEKKKNEKEARQFLSVMATFFILLAIIITVICMMLSPFFIKWMVHGFTPDQQSMTVTMTNVLLPCLIFFVLSAIATGVLNTNKKFTASAAIAIPQSLIIIGFVVFLSQTYGIWAAAIGTLLGSISQFAVQYPQFRQYKIGFSLNYKPYKQKIKDSIWMVFPVMIASIAVQLNDVTDRMFSSSLPVGSISSLNYANKLMYLPFSIVTLSIMTVFFPTIVDVAISQKEKLAAKVIQGGHAILYATFPFVILLLFQGEQIVQIAFERGAFTHEDTIKTASVLQVYAVALLFLSMRDYLMKCHLAAKETKIMMIISIVGVLVNILGSYAFSSIFGAKGIAMGFVMNMIVQTIWFSVSIFKNRSITKHELIPALKTAGSALVVGILIYFIQPLIQLENVWVQLMIMGMITAILYLFITKWFRCMPRIKRGA